jgi:hypothetical protein
MRLKDFLYRQNLFDRVAGRMSSQGWKRNGKQYPSNTVQKLSAFAGPFAMIIAPADAIFPDKTILLQFSNLTIIYLHEE